MLTVPLITTSVGVGLVVGVRVAAGLGVTGVLVAGVVIIPQPTNTKGIIIRLAMIKVLVFIAQESSYEEGVTPLYWIP